MPTPDREMLFRALAKLREQQAIFTPKPEPFFRELIDFHSSVNNRVSIPRLSLEEKRMFPVDFSQLEDIPVTTGRSFDYYVIDDQITEIDPNIWESQLYGLAVLERYYQHSRTCDEHLGDPTCSYSAKSTELRCTVNPYGPCDGCKNYQSGVEGPGGANVITN